MTSRHDAIVVGAGLGGLTAAALLARAGHRVLVLDKNAGFGGAATGFDRDGARFEVSLHETTLPGDPADPKTPIFAALELDDALDFVPVPDFYEVRSPHVGAPLVMPHGFDAIEAALAARFPGDAAGLRRCLRQIARTQEAIAHFSARHGGLWWLAHAPDLPLDLWAVLRDLRSSLSDVFERYFGPNEALKLAMAANLAYYADDPDRLWWLAYAAAQGGYFRGGGYYIRGGSSALTAALVEAVRGNGGAALAGHRVTGILTDAAGRVTGVRHHRPGADAAEDSFAPVVIAGTAPHALAGMLPEALAEDFMEPYRGRPLSISLFTVSYRLARPGGELGITAYSTALLPDWITRLADYAEAGALLSAAPGDRLPPLMVVDYGQIDSGLAGDGPAPVTVTGVDRLANWEGLDPAAYAARKSAWTGAITARLDAEWPGFAAAVAHAEMATARTMRDHLGTPGGAVYGFAPVVPDAGRLAGPPGTPRTAVQGLFLASSYAGFGGFTGAMGAGAAAAQAALRALG